MKLKLICFTILLFFIISGCTLFKKNIPVPIVCAIKCPTTISSISQTASYVKYVNLYSELEYQTAFLNKLNTEGIATPNVTIDNNSENPDFIIEVQKLTLSESDFIEKVNDAKSEFNGKEFLLNKVVCSAEVIVLNGKTKAQIGSNCFNSKIKQEDVKNNRNLGDLISGSNKDKSSYRQKTLRDDIALDLAGDVGRRIWVPITKRLKKAIN